MFLTFFLITSILITLSFPISPTLVASSNTYSFLNLITSSIVFSPILPLLLGIIRWKLRKPINERLTLILCVIVCVIGFFLTFISSFFAGPGASHALLHGIGLTIALSCSIRLMSISKTSCELRTLSGICLIIPLMISLWSLYTVMAVITSANQYSKDQPFCIATHDPEAEIKSYSQLRGLSFYTTGTGYKFNSRWYFHGILIVSNKSKVEVYNWSFNNMSFVHLKKPTLQINDPTYACIPHHKFWNRISIFWFSPSKKYFITCKPVSIEKFKKILLVLFFWKGSKAEEHLV